VLIGFAMEGRKEARMRMRAFCDKAGGYDCSATKKVHEKWPIRPISGGLSEIGSENTGYLPEIAYK